MSSFTSWIRRETLLMAVGALVFQVLATGCAAGGDGLAQTAAYRGPDAPLQLVLESELAAQGPTWS